MTFLTLNGAIDDIITQKSVLKIELPEQQCLLAYGRMSSQSFVQRTGGKNGLG